VDLNTIIVCPSGDRLEDSVELARLLDADIFLGSWRTWRPPETVTGEVIEGGWTRYYDFILAAWWSALTGWLSVSPPVIYLTALSCCLSGAGAVDAGSVKQIISSAASGLRQILMIMVRLTILGRFLINPFN
jgi:hypothetical protein